MKDSRPNGFYSTQVWIYLGATLFLVALLVSAIVVPELRLLHLMQALIYVAVIVLARRNSPWGFGAGFAISIVWTGLVSSSRASFKLAPLPSGHRCVLDT